MHNSCSTNAIPWKSWNFKELENTTSLDRTQQHIIKSLIISDGKMQQELVRHGGCATRRATGEIQNCTCVPELHKTRHNDGTIFNCPMLQSNLIAA